MMSFQWVMILSKLSVINTVFLVKYWKVYILPRKFRLLRFYWVIIFRILHTYGTKTSYLLAFKSSRTLKLNLLLFVNCFSFLRLGNWYGFHWCLKLLLNVYWHFVFNAVIYLNILVSSAVCDLFARYLLANIMQFFKDAQGLCCWAVYTLCMLISLEYNMASY